MMLHRYSLPVVVIIMNNSGIYGGDRRQQQLREAAHKGAAAAGFGADPEPTSFVPKAKSVFFRQTHTWIVPKPCAVLRLTTVTTAAVFNLQ